MCRARYLLPILIILLYYRTKLYAYDYWSTTQKNIDKCYIEKNILTAKQIFNYKIGLFMYKHVNNMTSGAFNNFSWNVSDQHYTRNTQNSIYVIFPDTTRGQKTLKYCVLILGILSSEIYISTVQLAHSKKILVSYFL